ncbi:SDR family oxidoreductase [soil metagenome]
MVAESRVLVAGANGQLGSVIVRKLAAAGIPVRALGRNALKLEACKASGVEVVPVDLMNLAALTEACRGAGQIVSTANNNMGKGATSPTKIDLTAHQNLCAAARNAGVRRIVYVSAHGIDQDSPVDIFRIKWYIEDAIRRSGVPYVILRPTAFMDVWVDQIIADSVRRKGAATIFGPGTARMNYIAVDDVAEFVVKILDREEVVNEVIEIGGPSTMSMNDVATLVEKQLGRGGRRRHIPVFAMSLLPPVVRLFDELTARMMTLGHFATIDQPFPGWHKVADRFGMRPRTIEDYIRG